MNEVLLCHKSTPHLHAAGYQQAKPLIFLENFLKALPVLSAFSLVYHRGVLLRVLWGCTAPCAKPWQPAQPSTLRSSCSSSTKNGKFKDGQISLEFIMLFQGLTELETQEILSEKDILCKRRSLSWVKWTAELLLLPQPWSELTGKFKSCLHIITERNHIRAISSPAKMFGKPSARLHEKAGFLGREGWKPSPHLLPNPTKNFGKCLQPCAASVLLTQFLFLIFYSILLKRDFMYNNLKIAEVRVFAVRKA